MNEIIYDVNIKMSEMITAHPGLATMLGRFGLSLGFGDKSVKDVCASRGVSVDFFLLMCNVYNNESYLPSMDDLLATDMSGLVPYLQLSHTYYAGKRLPHIEHHLHHIAEQMPQRVAGVFMRFFAEYRDEVTAHFHYEEKNVFPHIVSLQNGEAGTDYRIKDYLAAHSNIEDKLDDLLQIIFKYLPQSATGDDAVDVVYDILQLSADLKKHALIEEKILVPYVKTLEKKMS